MKRQKNSDFKAGDLVRLKSGGPIMTLVELGIEQEDKEDRCGCGWFYNNEYEVKYIQVAALEKVNEEEVLKVIGPSSVATGRDSGTQDGAYSYTLTDSCGPG